MAPCHPIRVLALPPARMRCAVLEAMEISTNADGTKPKLVINLLMSQGLSDAIQLYETKKSDAAPRAKPPLLSDEAERSAEERIDCFMSEAGEWWLAPPQECAPAHVSLSQRRRWSRVVGYGSCTVCRRCCSRLRRERMPSSLPKP